MRNKEHYENKFWSCVKKTSGCWIFQGTTDRGYGRMFVNGKNIGAHRFSYELHNGKIPSGLFICHHCDNPPCVNPKHLFAGTHSDNIKDAFDKGIVKNPVMKGEKHWFSRLKKADVINIRKLYPKLHAYQLSRKFKICPTQVYNILHRRNWAHV